MKIPVALYVEHDSVYKNLGLVDCFDLARDATTYRGSAPVIAHPPCRLWSRLSHLSTARPPEKRLALLAVDQVRRWGGVLEHPSGSRLWSEAALPLSGRDRFGGFTIALAQSWFGHRATKRTWLYVSGVEPRDVPAFPFHLGDASTVPVDKMSKRERIQTPPDFARWLIELASRCRAGQ